MNKDLIKISAVSKLIYELTGETRSRTTAYEWVRVGRISADGRRVKLETIKRLGKLYTTRKMVEEFIGEL